MSAVNWVAVVQKGKFDHILRERQLRQEDSLFQAEEGHDPVEFDGDPDMLYGAAHDKALEGLHACYHDDSAYDDWLEKEYEREWDNTDPRDSRVKAQVVAEIESDTRKWAEEDRLWEWHDDGYTFPPLFLTRVAEATHLRGTW